MRTGEREAVNIFPRAQRFTKGVPCIQIAWSERPDRWMDFEPRKPGMTAEEQIESVRAHFDEQKRVHGLRYGIFIRVAPSKSHSAPDKLDYCITRPHALGVSYLGKHPDGWVWVSEVEQAHLMPRCRAVRMLKTVRGLWRTPAQLYGVGSDA
jgi:hypothetical protein